MNADEFDLENRADAERYLLQAGHARPGDVVEHEVLAGGVSSKTVRIAFADGREWVLKQALAKLRVQADWFSDPRRVHREALGMKVLGELTPPGSVPKLIFDDEQHHVLGMEAVPRPHANWKTMLLAGRVNPVQILDFGRLLGKIHAHSRLRRRELELQFADRSFFETLRLEPYYEYGARQEPRAADFYRGLVAETNASREALTHGDFSPKNVLIYDNRLVLLDHEVIHWGDPAFDFGFGTSHLLSKSHHLPQARAVLQGAVDAFWKVYRSTHCEIESSFISSIDWTTLEARCVRHSLGCLLARVVGRSPLEYLTADERNRQREAVVRLIQDLPRDVPELIARFTAEIEY